MQKLKVGTHVRLKDQPHVVGEICEKAPAGYSVYWCNHPDRTRTWESRNSIEIIESLKETTGL